MPIYNGKQEPYKTNYTLNTILYRFPMSRQDSFQLRFSQCANDLNVGGVGTEAWLSRVVLGQGGCTGVNLSKERRSSADSSASVQLPSHFHT